MTAAAPPRANIDPRAYDRKGVWRRTQPEPLEVWELQPDPDFMQGCPPVGGVVRPVWTVYRVRANRTHRNPTGERWRAARDGEPLFTNGRLRSFGSRRAASEAAIELARLGL